MAPLAAVLALTSLCGPARADINFQSNATTPLTVFNNDPNGNAPFYTTLNGAITGLSAQSLTIAAGATDTAMGEIFSITNGAGGLGVATGTSNYVVTGIGILGGSFVSTTNIWIHLFDITSNLTGAVNVSSSTYNFTNNGDLLGEGFGLNFPNHFNSGAEQQIYLGLVNGPDTYGDQVVLQANHVYALEIWSPGGTGFQWYRYSTPADAGGQAMGSFDGALKNSRKSLASLGLAGGARTFGMALYGYATNAPGSVNLSTNMVGYTNIFIDQFNALSVTPGNPYYTNAGNPAGIDYSAGQIATIWGIFFGQGVNYVWDNTKDAQGNLNGGLGGSMQLQTTFTQGSQLVAWDGANGIAPALNGLSLGFTSFECDIMIDGTSATQTNAAGAQYFGNLQYGQRTAGGFGQDYYQTVTQVSPTNADKWIHVKVPVNPQSDANMAEINDVVFHIYGPFGNLGVNENDLIGTYTMWIDNIKFKAPLAQPLVPPPALKMLPTQPGTLRMFGIAPQYTRSELITVDPNQGWIGGPGDDGVISDTYTKPVSYSFTLSEISTSAGFQTHFMLLPNETGNYNGQDYSGANELWLQINSTGNATNVNFNVAWKINDTGSNPTNTPLNIANTPGVGKWTITFTGQTNGSVTVPNGSNYLFTINDPTVATDFANPTYAVFGIQANTVPNNFGTYDDYKEISITNTAGSAAMLLNGTNFDDVFIHDAAINTNLWSLRMDTTAPTGNYNITNAVTEITNTLPANALPLFLETTNTPFWITWNVTTNGYGLAESLSLTLPITNLVSPASFSGTNSAGAYNDAPLQINAGPAFWALIPKDCLAGTNASYFQVVNPPPSIR